MSSVMEDVRKAVELIAVFVPIPENMFILVVILKEWLKDRQLCVTHQLVCGISLWNVLHGVVEIIMSAFDYMKRTRVVDEHDFSLFFMYFFMSCNLWFSTWLCVHFCLKTVGINQRVYIYLQRSFPKILPWILFSSVLESLLFAIPINWYTISGPSRDLSHGYSNQNVSMTNTSKNCCHCHIPTLDVIGINVPFILFFSSASITIFFLCRHVKHVRDNAVGFRLSAVEAHVHAARTIACILLLNIGYFIGMAFDMFARPGDVVMHIGFVLVSVCNILTPIVLIKGNRTLNKALAESWAFCLSDIS